MWSGTLQISLFVSRGELSPFDLERLEAQAAVGELRALLRLIRSRVRNYFRDRVISVGLDELSRIEDIICVTHGTGSTKAIHAALKGLITPLVTDETGAREAGISRSRNRSQADGLGGGVPRATVR